MDGTDATPWLDADEQALWRRWLAVQALQPVAVGRGLAAESDLSQQDYVVLVRLSEHPQGRVRVTELASLLAWERSRVSHQVSRMERRGLVTRGDPGSDGRASWVVLSADGRRAIEAAAPGHVRLVRRVLFDALDAPRRELLDEILGDVLGLLEQELGIEAPALLRASPPPGARPDGPTS